MRRLIILLLLFVSLCSFGQTENDSVWRQMKLPEVTVKVKPIQQNGDTIKYNVASFQGKEDHYLEDVLKKLPGIEVAENGTISYRGNSINHLNIEGQDLLGNRYNQATRNLPVDAVAQVQIMENDQPVRALKDRKPSERATLNIKLKSGYKLKPFGEFQGGIGGFDNTLWDNHLTVINIAPKNQMLVTAKMNNTGESLSENTLEHVDITDIENYIPLPENIISTSISTYLPIQQKRYLRNKSYSIGINHLHRIGRYGSLRTNITYYGTSDQLSDSTYNLYGGSPTRSLYESNKRKAREYTFTPQLHYELNAPKVYLVDELSGSWSYTNNASRINSNELPLQELVGRHTSYAQNKLKMTLNTGNLIYTISSLTRYLRRSETMGIDDSTSTYDTGERITFQRMFTRNSISTSFLLFGNNMELKYGMEYRHDRIKAASDGFMRNEYLLNNLGIDYTIRYAAGVVTLGMPVNVFYSSVPWRQTDRSDTRVYVAPSIFWTHNFSPSWRLRINGRLNEDADNSILYPDSICTGYRTRMTTLDRIGWNRLSSLSFSLNYADFIRMFTWNMLASASWQKRDHRNRFSYGEEYTVITPVWEDTHSRMLMVQTSADKTFTGIGFSINGTINYTRNVLPVTQNDVEQTVLSNILSPSLKLRWNKLSWLQLSNKTNFNLSWQDEYPNDEGHSIRSWFNEFNLYIYPLKKISMEAECEYTATETDKDKFNRNLFVDYRMTYTPSKRIELGMTLNNVFNRKEYVEASYTGINYLYYSMPLRGREILFHIKFNLQ